jgi:hypothetical protein
MKRIISGLLAAVLLAGCGDDDNDADTEGRFSLAVTDAPVDEAEAVVVTFVAVELLGADGEPREVFTLDQPQSIDLLALQGTNSQFLVQDEVVPVGEYEEVRLILDTEDASCNNLATPFPSYIRIDGTDYPLVVPSGGQTGLKVKGPITVAAGGSAAYTVDFDLRRSIAERGATGCYNLRPVLRVVDNAEVGTLSGTVESDVLLQEGCTADSVSGEGAAIYIYSGAGVAADDVDGVEPEPLTSALLVPKDDGSGDFSYEVGFLLAGDYTAAFTCQAGDDTAEADEPIAFGPTADVTITADQVTTQDFTIEAAP